MSSTTGIRPRSSFDVAVTRGVPFAHALVGYNGGAGPMTARTLALDVYRPRGVRGQRPALVLAFGGAFHRGARDNDVRPENGPKNTSIAVYCERFAARGYVCFSIDYRLTQEDPHPGFTPTLGTDPVPTSRIDVVREMLGLAPATPDMLRRAQEAAIDDMVSGYRFVAGEAAGYGVDPSRIAIGGFSAGARMAVTAAFAESISPAAVVALSGVAAPGIVDAFHASGRRRPPVFVAWGDDDLDYVIPGAKAMVARFEAAGHPFRACRLPGQTHFYDAASPVVASHGRPASLEQAIAEFLDEHLADRGRRPGP